MNTRNTNSKIIAAILAAVMCIACLCACDANPDRITEIYFVSFTESDNSLYMKGENLGPKWRPLLKQKAAIELAHEVEAIPDASETEGEYSFIIRISYIEDGVEKHVEKTGYNTFPENWDKVVELTNKVSGEYDHVSNSRELAVIDAAYVREHSLVLDESIIPENMTLDGLVEAVPITYLTLYDPSSYNVRGVQDAIVNYLYDYYDLKSHQIDRIDENPAKSSSEEMKDFADARLDEVAWEYASEYSCAGTYKGEEYWIIRYDMVQTWLAEQSKHYDKCGFDGSHCQYQTQDQWETGGYEYTDKDVFVDGAGKYLILTNCNKPADIADVVS